MTLTATSDLDHLRSAVDRYVEETDREFYLHGSGQKDVLEFAAIAARLGAPFTEDALRDVLRARDAAVDDGERRRLMALAHVTAEIVMDRELAPLVDELGTAQASAVVNVDGEEMPYFSATVAAMTTADRSRRGRFEAVRLAKGSEFDPLRLRLHRRQHELIHALTGMPYVDAYSALKGIDFRALGAVMRAFLDRTRDLYLHHLAPAVHEAAGVWLDEAERHDIAFTFRMREHDQRFSAGGMLEALRATLLRLGIALDDQPNVHLDTEDRPAKSPRAFCAPVRTPDEVYLVIRPSGGYQDWRALFHEAGHTEHFAHTDAQRPVEERRLGDNSVTEAYAFTMEHLLLDRAWLADHTGIGGAELDHLSARSHLHYLYMLRRYAAKLVYELELHEAGADGTEGMADRYATILGDALGVRMPPQLWIDDVDPGFYSAQYLRAWMLEAQLRRRWLDDYGSRWWAEGKVGAELRSLWGLGQALPADVLAREIGTDGLGIHALEERIRHGLARA